MSEKAVPTKIVDNARTRVTEWRFAPGAETGFHRHEMDYVVVPITTGQLKIVSPDGTVFHSDLEAGKPYFRQAGVEHNVINADDVEFAFIEIEFK